MMSLGELTARTGEVADALLDATQNTSEADEPVAEDNSRRRVISEELRGRFIEVRDAMQRLGIVDPVLIRFDSYTVRQAPTREIGERLRQIADRLGKGLE
jgi:hypothetical protein